MASRSVSEHYPRDDNAISLFQKKLYYIKIDMRYKISHLRELESQFYIIPTFSVAYNYLKNCRVFLK